MRKKGKRRALIALPLALCLLLPTGCTNQTDPPTDTAQTTAAPDADAPIRTEGKWRIGESETMIYYFHFADFSEEEAAALLADATALSEELCTWLGVEATDMVSAEGKKAVCYFNSNHRLDDGQKRSQADTRGRKIYCVAPADYVHEYVHLVTDCSERQISLPSRHVSEGLATYIGFTWQDTVASADYASIPRVAAGGLSSDPTERAAMEQMLADASLEMTPLNVYRVGVAYSCITLGIDRMLAAAEDSEFYCYNIGCVLIDYLMKQPGGREDVMALCFDAMQAESLYGATLDALVCRAVEDCVKAFE